MYQKTTNFINYASSWRGVNGISTAYFFGFGGIVVRDVYKIITSWCPAVKNEDNHLLTNLICVPSNMVFDTITSYYDQLPNGAKDFLDLMIKYPIDVVADVHTLRLANIALQTSTIELVKTASPVSIVVLGYEVVNAVFGTYSDYAQRHANDAIKATYEACTEKQCSVEEISAAIKSSTSSFSLVPELLRSEWIDSIVNDWIAPFGETIFSDLLNWSTGGLLYKSYAYGATKIVTQSAKASMAHDIYMDGLAKIAQERAEFVKKFEVLLEQAKSLPNSVSSEVCPSSPDYQVNNTMLVDNSTTYQLDNGTYCVDIETQCVCTGVVAPDGLVV